MKLRKFCMVTTFFPPYNFGGDGIFVYRLTNALARLGHQVDVVHDVDAFQLLSKQAPNTAYPLHPNVTLRSLSGQRMAALDLVASHQLGRPVAKRAELRNILEKNNYELIHFHNISLLGGPHLLEYGNAIKFCTTHDHWFVCAMHVLWRFDREVCTKRTCLACSLHGRRPPQLWRYDGTLKRAVKYVDAFIAPSEFARASHYKQGFSAPMQVIPYFMPDGEVTRLQEAQGSYRHPRPYFLFVGRLEKLKGLQVVIDLFKEYDKADLIIAGTGTYETELHRQAHGLSHVHFLGFLSHRQLHSLYEHAIAVLIPSICYETFGWITLEAFCMRTPVIVHDLGPLPEVVQDGGGFVYRSGEEMREAMECLRTQPGLRKHMGEQGYHNFERNYTELSHMNKYFALIERIEAARQMRQSKQESSN